VSKYVSSFDVKSELDVPSRLVTIDDLRKSEEVPEDLLRSLFLEKFFNKYGGKKIEGPNARGPDFIGVKDGKKIRIEIEKRASDFLMHNREPKEYDVVYCLYKDSDLPVQTERLIDKTPTKVEIIEMIKNMGPPEVLGNYGLLYAVAILLKNNHRIEALRHIFRWSDPRMFGAHSKFEIKLFEFILLGADWDSLEIPYSVAHEKLLNYLCFE
jgi:hypothetical protein